MIIETSEVPEDRSLLAHHTFSCALPTRGGVCDCLPGPEDPSEVPADPSGDPARTDGVVRS